MILLLFHTQPEACFYFACMVWLIPCLIDFIIPFSIRGNNPLGKLVENSLVLLLVPRRRRKKGLIKWSLAVCPSVRPSICPSVRSLPRYLRIALVDFDDIFRKGQPYAKLERDIFGFLKNYFLGRILGKKGQKMSTGGVQFFFRQSLIFLPIFENMHV